MQPCAKNRRAIASLVMGGMEDRAASELRAHMEVCRGCRKYHEEISGVVMRLKSSQPDMNVEVTERFYGRLASRLEEQESGSFLETLAAWIPRVMFRARVVLPAGALLLFGVMVAVVFERKPAARQRAAASAVVTASSQANGRIPPTIANYQRIANESLDAFSQLLTMQGQKQLPPAPLYTPWDIHEASGAGPGM